MSPPYTMNRCLFGLAVFATAVCLSTPTLASSREYTDEELDTQMELVHLKVIVARLQLPMPLRQVLAGLDEEKNLHWNYTSHPSHLDWHLTEMVFSVVSPRLKGKGYYVVIQGPQIFKGDDQVTYVAVGYREPIGNEIYLCDVNMLRGMLNEPKEANKPPLQTPTSVTPAADAPVAPAIGRGSS